MSLSSQSLLATAFSGIELAVLICMVALWIALVTVCVVLIITIVKQKKSNTNEQVQEKPAPIIIYETKKVAAPKPAEAPQPAPQPVVVVVKEEVKEEPAPVAPVESEVAVAEAVQPAPVVEDDTELAMRYNRSFRARLIQSDDEVKEWYGILKNDIMSYKKVSSRISWKLESFNYRRNPVAKLFIKGKTLYLYLPLNAADYADTKYKLEDVSKIAQFADTPALYKLKSERRIKYAQDLIAEICAKLGSEKTEREPVDYYEPYNSDVALIKKGLVKRVIEDANKSFIGATGFSKAQDADTDFNSNK